MAYRRSVTAADAGRGPPCGGSGRGKGGSAFFRGQRLLLYSEGKEKARPGVSGCREGRNAPGWRIRSFLSGRKMSIPPRHGGCSRRRECRTRKKLFRYRRASRVNTYCLADCRDYFYGFMVWHTGYLRWFDLRSYDEGFVLLFPERESPGRIPDFHPSRKLFKIQQEAERWGERMGVNGVGDLNECISQGESGHLTLVAEALQESRGGGNRRGDQRKAGGQVCAHRRSLFFRGKQLFPDAWPCS